MKRKAVWVTWHDSTHINPGNWSDGPPDDPSVVIDTVGILVRRTKTHLILAQSIARDDDLMAGLFSIPRVNVLKVQNL